MSTWTSLRQRETTDRRKLRRTLDVDLRRISEARAREIARETTDEIRVRLKLRSLNRRGFCLNNNTNVYRRSRESTRRLRGFPSSRFSRSDRTSCTIPASNKKKSHRVQKLRTRRIRATRTKRPRRGSYCIFYPPKFMTTTNYSRASPVQRNATRLYLPQPATVVCDTGARAPTKRTRGMTRVPW